MTDKKISIIVPIYNLEKYLENSLDSLLAQTYKNLEIILVDDGSNDASAQICDDFAKKDDRVNVIHKKNAGVSAARNSGLKIASGDYIGFFDGDDSADPDMFEFLMSLAQKDNADIAMCEVRTIMEDGTQRSLATGEHRIWNSCSDFLKDLFNGKVSIDVYTKLFKKEVVNGVVFPEDCKTNEDKYFLFSAALNSSKFSCDSQAKYTYFRRAGSSSNTRFTQKYFDCVTLADRILDETRKRYPELEENALCNKLSTVLRIYKLIYTRNGLEEFKKEADELYCFMRDFDKSVAKKFLPLNDLTRFLILRTNKKLFLFLTKHFDRR